MKHRKGDVARQYARLPGAGLRGDQHAVPHFVLDGAIGSESQRQPTHGSLLRQRGIYRRLYELQYKDQEEEQPSPEAGAGPGGDVPGGAAAAGSAPEGPDSAVTAPAENPGAEAAPTS